MQIVIYELSIVEELTQQRYVKIFYTANYFLIN